MEVLSGTEVSSDVDQPAARAVVTWEAVDPPYEIVGLTFLGLGGDPYKTSEWGLILNQGWREIGRGTLQVTCAGTAIVCPEATACTSAWTANGTDCDATYVDMGMADRDAGLAFRGNALRRDTDGYRDSGSDANADGYLEKKELLAAVGRESQAGFTNGRGCPESSFSLKNVLQSLREHGQEPWVCFIDLVKAFDSIDRGALCDILLRYGAPPALVSVIKGLHAEVNVRMEAGDDFEEFESTLGVLQGAAASPVRSEAALGGLGQGAVGGAGRFRVT